MNDSSPGGPDSGKPDRARLRFGDFEFDHVGRRLLRLGVPVRLNGQPRDILAILLEQPGEIVTRQQLQDRLWGSEVVVEFDAAINTAIKKIRQVLDDDAANPRFLETLPRQGYRFIHPIQSVLPESPPQPAVRASRALGDRERVALRRPAILWSAGAVFAIAIVLAIGPLSFFRHTESPLHVEPLTRLPNDAYRASFSPDGSRVVFCWSGYQDGAATTLWIKQVDGSAFHPLTTKGRDEFPAWSPDGKWIAFVRSLKDVMIVPSLGGPERKIAETPTYYLSWVPDSSAVVVGTPRHGTVDTFDYAAISIETGARTPLTSSADQVYGYQPFLISPDGHHLGFTHRPSPGEEAELFVRPLAGGHAVQLSPAGWHVDGWTWTPDSSEVVFASNPDGYEALWRVGAEGGTPRQIQLSEAREVRCPFTVPAMASRSTPAGQLLGFENWDRKINVRQLTLEYDSAMTPHVTGPPLPVFPSSAEEHSLEFSPDGQRVAFISTRTGYSELWLGTVSSSDAVQLTTLGRHNDYPYSPAWSNDGSRIAFEVHHGTGVPAFAEPGQETSRIVVNSVSGGAAEEISTVGLNVRPAWSSDDKWIYFGSRRSGTWQLWRHAASPNHGSVPPGHSDGSVQVTSGGGFEALESSDGRYLFYKKDPADEDLWMMPIGPHGPVERDSVRIISGGVFAGWWAAAGNGIYYADIATAFKGQYPTSHPKPIYYFDLRTRRRTQLASIDHHILFYLADFGVSRDGRKLAYSQIEFHGIDLDMVRNFH